MNIDVCVTDCDTKHGFAIARSLRKKELKIVSQYRNKINPFYYSIHNNPKYICDFKKKGQTEKFINYLALTKPNVLIPVSNTAVNVISENRELIQKFTKILLPGEEALEIAQNKSSTFKFAQDIGVKCPKTIYDIRSNDNLAEVLNKFTFPVVLKYVNYYETGVRYCSTLKEINSILSNYNNPSASPPILQEFIEGVGVGFYALYKNGVCINYFMHKRLHEYPVTGGASSFAMSYYNEELKMNGLKILDSLKWNGIAMVEFKLTDKDELYLMEINPKFWGSYELSEKCGIEFAYKYYKLANGATGTENKFKTNVGFRWMFSEIMYYRDNLFISKNKKIVSKKHNLEKIYNDIYLDEPLILIARIIDILIRIFIKRANPHSIPNKNI